MRSMLLNRTRAAFALVVSALVSCGTSDGGGRRPAPAVLPPTEVVPELPASDSPIERLAIDAPACEATVAYVTLKGRGEPKLCDATSRRCYLEVGFNRGTVVAKTAKGQPASVLLEVLYGGMVLRGFIAEPERYAARPIVFAGFFIPEQIEIKEGRERAVLATATIEASIEPQEPIEQAIACGDIVWEKPTFDDETVARLTKAAGKGELLTLAGGSTLFDDEGNAVVTFAASRPVIAHQIVRGRRLIVDHVAHGTIFGWVLPKALSSLERGRLGGSHRTRPPHLRLVPDPSKGLRCKQDVTVLALVEGARLDVGTVPANTWFSLGEDADRHHREILLRHPLLSSGEITYPVPGVALVPGAKLVVQTSSIVGCEPG